jgi:hypothetical protein
MSDKLKGIIGTILFHTMVLGSFLFFGFRTPMPLHEQESVELVTDVNLGNSDQGFGDIQPLILMENNRSGTYASQSNYLNQNVEETVNLSNATSIPNNSKNDNSGKIDSKSLYTGRNIKSVNQGTKGGNGDQGDPNGNPNSKNYNGTPDLNNSISFSLTGRKSKKLTTPSYDSDEQGQVVVEVTVDQKGKVTKAKSGVKGTSAIDKNLWKQAEKAALSSTFDSKDKGPVEQKGTITYIFLKLN